jgi:hypothetical protein
MKFVPLLITAFSTFSGLAGPAEAQNSSYATKIFGHDIYVTDQVGRDDLMIDGTSALSDGEVIIWEIGLAGDAPFIMGWTGSGGSMCASVPFIISFASDAPSVDVLPIECGRIQHQIGDGQILFDSPGIPGSPGMAYLWTPEAGFKEVEASVMDPGSAWDAIRQRQITAPNQFLNYPDSKDLLEKMAGDLWSDFVKLISGPPDAIYRGSYLIASNCLSGNCPFGGTLIIADMANQELYIAWEPSWDAPGEIRPALSEWPEDLRQELESWQSHW